MNDLTTSTTAGARDIALCRSLLYRAASLGFLPPSGETLRVSRRWDVMALAEAARLLDDDGGTDLAAKTLALAAQPDSTDLSALAAAYQRLFGHVAQGPVPAYETEYGPDEMFQKPQEMSDIAGFLSAFGLRSSAAGHERIDHIACELELAAFLAMKEAHAAEVGDATMLAETRKAMRLFLKDHLGRFVPSFTSRLCREAAAGFYGALGDLCRELVASDCRRYQAPLGPAALRLRLPIEDGAPMACGSAPCPGACEPDEAGAGEETER